MFTSSLMTRRSGPGERKRAWILTSSLVLHALALATVAGFQIWRVEAVAEPATADVFQVLLPPPIPATPEAEPKVKPGSRRSAQPQQAARAPQIPSAPARPLTQPDLESPVRPVPPVNPDPPLTDGPVTPADAGPWRDGPAIGGDRDGPLMNGSDERPLPIGGPISRPQIVPGTRVQPVYTELARKARLQGTVVLQATIDEAGNVIDMVVLKALPMGLDREALKAVSQWKFTPALLHGRPVKVFFSVTVHFETH